MYKKTDGQSVSQFKSIAKYFFRTDDWEQDRLLLQKGRAGIEQMNFKTKTEARSAFRRVAI